MSTAFRRYGWQPFLVAAKAEKHPHLVAARAAQWTVARRKSCHHQREHRPCCTPWKKKTNGPLKPHQQSAWLTGLLSSSTSSWWVIPSHLEKNMLIKSNHLHLHTFLGVNKIPNKPLKPPETTSRHGRFVEFFVPPSVANSLLNHGTFLSFTWPTCHKLTLGGSFSCGKKKKKRPGVKLVFLIGSIPPTETPSGCNQSSQMEVEVGSPHT